MGILLNKHFFYNFTTMENNLFEQMGDLGFSFEGLNEQALFAINACGIEVDQWVETGEKTISTSNLVKQKEGLELHHYNHQHQEQHQQEEPQQQQQQQQYQQQQQQQFEPFEQMESRKRGRIPDDDDVNERKKKIIKRKK